MILKKQFLRHLQGQHNSRKSTLLSPRHDSQLSITRHQSNIAQQTNPHGSISNGQNRLQIQAAQSFNLSLSSTSANIEEILAYIKQLFTTEVSLEVENDAFSLLKKIEFITIATRRSNCDNYSKANSVDHQKLKKRIPCSKKSKNLLPSIMNNLAFIYHRKDKNYASHLYSQKAIEQDTLLTSQKAETNLPLSQCWDIISSPRQTTIQPKRSIGQIISLLNFTYTTLNQQLQPNLLENTLRALSVELQQSIRMLKSLKKTDGTIFNSSNRILISFPILKITSNLSSESIFKIEQTQNFQANESIQQIELEGLSFYYLGMIESLTSNSLSTAPLRRSMDVFQPLANNCKFHRVFLEQITLLLSSISDISHSSSHLISKSVNSTPRSIGMNNGDFSKRSYSNRINIERTKNQRQESTNSYPEKQNIGSNSNRALPQTTQMNQSNSQVHGLNYLYSTEIPPESSTRQSIRPQKNQIQIYSPRGDSPHQLFKSSIITSVISAETSQTTPKESFDSNQLKKLFSNGSAKQNIKARRVLRLSNEHGEPTSHLILSRNDPQLLDSSKTSNTTINRAHSYHKPTPQNQNENKIIEDSYHVSVPNDQINPRSKQTNSNSVNLRGIKRNSSRENSEKQQRTVLKEIHRFLEANAVSKPNLQQFKQYSKVTSENVKSDLTPRNIEYRSISPFQTGISLDNNILNSKANRVKQTNPSEKTINSNLQIINQQPGQEIPTSPFLKYCQKQTLTSTRYLQKSSGNHSTESQGSNKEKSIQGSLSILETANSVASKLTSEESKGRVISSFCRFSTTNVDSDPINLSPKKSIDSVDKIYGSKKLLNSFRTSSNSTYLQQQQQQIQQNNSHLSQGYDQSARLHRCMDEDFSLPSTRQIKKKGINSRYSSTENHKQNNKASKNSSIQSDKNLNNNKPAFIDSFIHRHTKEFVNSLAKRINSKLNFLSECIHIQLEQEEILCNALLSDNTSSTDSRDSDEDDIIS